MQSLLWFLLVPLCTGLRFAGPHKIPADPHQISEAQSDDCVIVANLHFRKCAGSTVRLLFGDKAFVAKYGWQQLGNYCSDVYDTNLIKQLKEANFKGKFWKEQHCNQDIVEFNLGVAKLRAEVEPKGCRVVTTALFRSPVQQAVSEYSTFCANPDSPRAWWQTQKVARLHDWAARNPENLFHMVLSKQHELWDKPNQEDSIFETCKVNYRELTSCESALKTLDSAVSQINIAGRMDSMADFNRFWIRLGDAAGFDPLFHGSNSALPHPTTEKGIEMAISRSAAEENLISSEYEHVASKNPCYSKWYAEKMKSGGLASNKTKGLSRNEQRASRNEQMAYQEMEKRVTTLSSLWKDMVLE